MNRAAVRAAIVAFIASFCTLVIELVAGRVLAPYVGVSLYTWTSIIGVVLAGISVGAWAGGWLADRRPAASTLGWLLIAAGVLSILIAPATGYLAADEGVLTSMGLAETLLARVVVLSILLFFLPSFFLGMISPVAVKLAVRELDTAGSVVGKIYAISTLGSIAGTFVTGFYLVARFGSRATLVGVGVVLIASALLFGGLFGRIGRAGAIAVLAVGAAYAGLWPGSLPPPHQNPLLPATELGVIHSEESQYYAIRVERTVRDDTGAPLHALQLDHLTHSYSDLDDPEYLEYGYMRLFEDVLDPARDRYLFIGGGGYTLPRLIHHRDPDARVDVVEIDPAVTRAARRFFALPRSARIRTINEDARWFSMREGEGPYDAIFIDAFNDLSVPYHLTTREQTERLRAMLAPDGVLLANVIDDFGRGRFLASYVRTLEAVFGAGKVVVVLENEADRASNRSTFVVAASLVPLRFREPGASVMAGAELRRWLAARDAIVLTDDFAPVDNMLAPLFRERFADELQGE